MKVKEIKALTDRDTKILMRRYASGEWIKNRDITPDMDELEVKHIYTKCHECGTPKMMRSQLVLMV